MPKKETSNNELAHLIKVGFDGVDKNFHDMNKYVDKRFDKIEKRLGALENGNDNILLRLSNVAYRYHSSSKGAITQEYAVLSRTMSL